METFTLFARLKGVVWSEIAHLCHDMIVLFDLAPYKQRSVRKLRYGFGSTRESSYHALNLAVATSER